MSNEVIPRQTSALSTQVNYGQDAGVGFEGISASEVLVPRFDVLQATERRDDPRADGDPRGGVGDLFNTVTREVFPAKTGIAFVPVFRSHNYVAWTPKNPDGSGGGGPWATLLETDPIVIEAKKSSTEFGSYTTKGPTGEVWDLVETFTLGGLVLNEDDFDDVVGFAILGITSSKIPNYKALMTQLTHLAVKTTTEDGTVVKENPPIFANRLRVTGARKENRNGKTSYVYGFAPLKGTLVESLIPSDSPLLAQARLLREMLQQGTAKVVEGPSTTATVEGDANPFA